MKNRWAERSRPDESVDDPGEGPFPASEPLLAFAYSRSPDGSIRFADPGFRAIFGNPEEEPSPRFRRMRKALLSASRASRVFETLTPEEWEWEAPSGRVYRVYDCPVGGAGSGLEVLEMGVDITGTRRAAGKLREIESFLHSLYGSSPVMMGVDEVLEDDIVHVSCNEAAAGFFGRTAASLRGRRASEIGVPPERIRTWIEHFGEAERTGRSHRFEYAAGDPPGRKWLAATVSFIGRSPEGHSRFSYVVEDITERKHTERMLRDRTETLQAVVQASPVAIEIVDREGNLQMWNLAAERIFGWTEEEVRGRFQPTVPEEDRGAFLALVDRVLRGETVRDVETRRRRKDGSLLDARMSMAPLHGQNGTVYGAVAVLEDVTERKRAEEAVASERAFRETIGDSLLVGLSAVDLAGRIIYVNDALCRMTGWSREELVGMPPPFPFWPPEEVERNLKGIGRLLSGERAMDRVEIRFMRRGGERFDVILHSSPLRDSRGRVWGYVASIHDITDRKEAEEALKESEERFRTLVEHSLVGFFIVQEGRIVFMNPEQKRLFGPLPERARLDYFTGLHPDDVKKFHQLCESAPEGRGAIVEAELRFFPYLAALGEREMRWVHGRATPVRYEGAEAVLVNMVDVTRTRRMEEAMEKQQKMASLGHVATGIAHEIRNPLSGLNIYLSALEKLLTESEELPPDRKEMARHIADQARSASSRIESVIARVMDFARPAPPHRIPVDANRCIEEAKDLSAVILRRVGIRIDLTLREDLPRCQADPRLIEQVLLNLITNAAQALEEQGGEKRIEIRSDLEGAYIAITVADSGPGIPPRIRERIFEPFFTTKSEGTGVGLSFSRKVIADHGGFITAGPSRFGGAEFRILIPIMERRKSPRAA